MTTSANIPLPADNSWVEITSAGGVSGLLQNVSPFHELFVAETEAGGPAQGVLGQPVAPKQGYVKNSTGLLFARSELKLGAAVFTPWSASAE